MHLHKNAFFSKIKCFIEIFLSFSGKGYDHVRGDGAAGFFPVGAIVKPTLSYVGGKVRKGILQVLLQDHIHLIRVERGKSGGIRNIGVFAQVVQLHMAGGMAASAQLLGNLAGGQLQLRSQAVQNPRVFSAKFLYE